MIWQRIKATAAMLTTSRVSWAKDQFQDLADEVQALEMSDVEDKNFQANADARHFLREVLNTSRMTKTDLITSIEKAVEMLEC